MDGARDMSLEGHSAPDFTLPRDGGGAVTLSTFRPQKVVLYFYPKDDTPGCTTEARDFTRLGPDFAAAGADEVLPALQAHRRPAQGVDL